MKLEYSIESKVIFSPENNSLMVMNEALPPVKLSNQATRLLLEMIINKHNILNRDDLLKKVWEDQGFSSSYNTLNVAISELRKSFKSLGLDSKEIISTIHKKGVILNGRIEPITREEVLTNGDSFPYSGGTPYPPLQSTQKKPWFKFSIKKYTLLFLAIFLIFITQHVINKHISKSIPKEEKINFIYKFKACNIYTMGSVKTKKEDITSKLQREKIDCTKSTDVFFKINGENNELYKSTFIGVCHSDEKSNYTDCWSITNMGDS